VIKTQINALEIKKSSLICQINRFKILKTNVMQ